MIPDKEPYVSPTRQILSALECIQNELDFIREVVLDELDLDEYVITYSGDDLDEDTCDAYGCPLCC